MADDGTTSWEEYKRRAEARRREAEGAAWPEPEELGAAAPSVRPFDSALLPEAFRPWIEDIAERIQCPMDFPAVGAMTALAGLVGRGVGIRPKRRDDWLEVPNLWGGIVGRPGIMKTPALAQVMKPLNRLAAIARKAHEARLTEFELEKDIRKLQREVLLGELKSTMKGKGRRTEDLVREQLTQLDGAPETPVARRYLTNDPTAEKIGELLVENPRGLLLFRDELTGWLRSLEREGRENDRAFYLEAWNGRNSYTYDRIGRGTVHIESHCVSILGGIQPGPLSAYVREALSADRGADGLLQRFQLLVFPDDSSDWVDVDRWPDAKAKATAYAVFDRLAEWDARAAGAKIDESSEIPYLQFDGAAQEIFSEWRTELERGKLRNGEPECIEAHLAKYRKLVPALALLIELADRAAIPDKLAEPHPSVTEPAMLRAAAWAEYLETHARRVYAAATQGDLLAARALADKIRAGRLPDPFRPRDVYRQDWQHLDADGSRCAIEILEEHHWLRAELVQTGGRPSLICRLNPRIRR